MDKKRCINLFFITAFFIAIFIFFAVIHPMYIYISDDWLYISYRRIAAPVWGAWNPAKVLPETIVPFMSSVAVYMLYPLTHDYFNSLMYVHAFFATVFLVVYVYMFYRLCVKKFCLDQMTAWLLSSVFIAFHFFIYCSKLEKNIHVFYSICVNEFFNYPVPALLNMTIVLYFMGGSDVESDFITNDNCFIKKGMVFVALYFAIFSNLFHSIILMSYVFGRLLQGIIRILKKEGDLIWFIKKYLLHLSCVVMWIVCLIFEANGMRADEQYGKSIDVIQTFTNFLLFFRKINYIILILSIIVLIAGFIAYLLNSKKENADMDESVYRELGTAAVFCIFINSVFLIMLCSVTGAGYIERSTVIISVMLEIIMLIFISGIYLIKRFEFLKILIPLALLILPTTSAAFHGEKGRIFKDCFNADPKLIYEMDNYILDQIIEADVGGKSEVVLNLPKWYGEAEWPFPDYFNEIISTTLYRQGITKCKMVVITED